MDSTDSERPADSAGTRNTDHSPRCVTISNRKGGVGKTALAINIADRLADRGHGVLLVDADPAGHATEGVGLRDAYTDEVHIGQYLAEEDSVTLGDVIRPTDHDFDVVTSHRDLGRYATQIDSEDRFAILCLEQRLVEPLLGDEYDYIVVDSPAASGSLLADATLVAAGNVIVPMEPGEESIRGFEQMMQQQIAPIRENREVNILALVPNHCRSDNELKRLVEQINEHFPEYTPRFAHTEMLETSPGAGIRERIAIKRAWRDGVPLSKFDPDNDMLGRFDELATVVERGGVDG
jgi:chromosome partitioning protein